MLCKLWWLPGHFNAIWTLLLPKRVFRLLYCILLTKKVVCSALTAFSYVPCASNSIKFIRKITWQVLVWKVAQQKKKTKTNFELDQLLLGHCVYKHQCQNARTKEVVAMMGKASWTVLFAERTVLGQLIKVAM